MGQAQDATIEFGLGIAGPLGRGDDLVGRGERVRGVLGAPQDVVPGGQRGGEGRGGGAPVRIPGYRLARVLHGPFGGIAGISRRGGERDRQAAQGAGAQGVVGRVQRRGRLAEQRGGGVRGGVEVEVLGVQQCRGGQQPRLARMPGEPDGFVDDPGRGGIGPGLGQRLGQAEQQPGPVGRGGLRRPALHVQGVPEMTGGLLVGQRAQRLLAGQPGVVHGPGGGFGAGGGGPQEVIRQLGVAVPGAGF